ncbi:unnamed protein product [Haemonchus placei]|uniref:Uncharacterized protein n=1 Tax=Haemonchus placei TaxID=6290 RepID=A0A0N4WUQ5_HAEPC|nr:unnamed protein product [Haemonchus placei]
MGRSMNNLKWLLEALGEGGGGGGGVRDTNAYEGLQRGLQHHHTLNVQQSAAQTLVLHTDLTVQKNRRKTNRRRHRHHRTIIYSPELNGVAYGCIPVHVPEIVHDHEAVHDRRYAHHIIMIYHLKEIGSTAHACGCDAHVPHRNRTRQNQNFTGLRFYNAKARDRLQGASAKEELKDARIDGMRVRVDFSVTNCAPLPRGGAPGRLRRLSDSSR